MKEESLLASMPKLILAISLIVGIGTVAGAMIYYLKMPKNKVVNNNKIEQKAVQDETVDWKTYRNEKYGFKVKYPADWKEENNRLYSPEMYNVRERGSLSFSLMITLNSSFNSIDEELEYQGKCKENVFHYTINGKEIAGYSNACDFYEEKIIIMIVEDQMVEGISYSFSDESKIISQILSTFKFIEK
ncbi:MAG: PsbP-related protein [Patescibacteria group bacterium]|nr:PsbP-related protein [Patescibacteria group bacterium]